MIINKNTTLGELQSFCFNNHGLAIDIDKNGDITIAKLDENFTYNDIAIAKFHENYSINTDQ